MKSISVRTENNINKNTAARLGKTKRSQPCRRFCEDCCRVLLFGESFLRKTKLFLTQLSYSTLAAAPLDFAEAEKMRNKKKQNVVWFDSEFFDAKA